MHAFMWHSCIKTTCLSWWCLVFDRHFQETHNYWCDGETVNEWLTQYNNLLWERDSDSSAKLFHFLHVGHQLQDHAVSHLTNCHHVEHFNLWLMQPQDFSSLHSSNLNRNAAQSELSHLHPKPHAALNPSYTSLQAHVLYIHLGSNHKTWLLPLLVMAINSNQ